MLRSIHVFVIKVASSSTCKFQLPHSWMITTPYLFSRWRSFGPVERDAMNLAYHPSQFRPHRSMIAISKYMAPDYILTTKGLI